jgi:hypothetical protein
VCVGSNLVNRKQYIFEKSLDLVCMDHELRKKVNDLKDPSEDITDRMLLNLEKFI